MSKEYYVGLDMGTNSVGWAVTDAQYNLIRKKGKDFWGVREFDRTEGAVSRRTNRISRRRRRREQVRIGYLKSYFEDEIRKVDPNFFVRLENSKYFVEDKDDEVKSKNAIFDDDNFTDKEYFKEYPTIFHLRKELIDSTEPHDIRLVYLAILNLFKRRGHFLEAGLSEDGFADKAVYESFVVDAAELAGLTFKDGVYDDLIEVLANRRISRSEKHDKIMDIYGFAKQDKRESLCIKAICGLKIKAEDLFEDLSLEEKVEVQFSDFSYEDGASDIENALGSEKYQLIQDLKNIYDAGVLNSILKGYASLSHARVAEYQKHHDDLVQLKKVYRELGKDKYDNMFRKDEANTYSAYVNTVNSSKNSNHGKPMRRSFGGRKREDLYSAIKKDLKALEGREDVNYILEEISKETFLPKQLNAGNGVIPNQVHAKELKAILQNAKEYLPFLNEVDETGLKVSERIEKIYSFQIPYYIGPTSELSAKSGGNGWVVRKAPGVVMPWNLEEKIDVAKTSEAFIKRLIRECTYIAGEKVLPKNALIYEKFRVLNEINNIRVKGERISVDLKQDLYKEKFLTGKRVTRKQIVAFLANRYREIGEEIGDENVSGIDKTINNSLQSYGKFKAIFGEDMAKDDVKRMADEIIYYGTIYGDDKKLYKRKLSSINEEHGNRLSDEQLKRIAGYKFRDWGRLSKEFLELQGVNPETGEIISLIEALWDTNLNLMELINANNFGFKESLAQKQKQVVGELAEFKFEDMDDMYFSAPVKRMIWQTLLILKEIQHVMGCAPSKLFVEMTREEGEKGDKGRKDSRAKKLIELYKAIKNEEKEFVKEAIESIKKEGETGRLRSKKLYLYYRQMGRCMYTGDPIDLVDLMSANSRYDIDHIYPRHFVKDDNIENNLVLVTKETNQYKSDVYPLKAMSDKVYRLWDMLHRNNLMNDEKYNRLKSRKPFSDEQLAGFIARQIVETGQGTKGVADLIKGLMPDTKIIYSKAGNVSDFRRDFNLLKSRAVNDFHHAKDAYLNVVVGNVYYTKFTQNPINFIKNEYRKSKEFEYHFGHMFDRVIKRSGYTAWCPEREGETPATITTVKKVMAKNTPLLTRMNLEKTGSIANATLYPASKAKKEEYIPLKARDDKLQDVTTYGGYTSVRGAYFFLVEHETKKEKVRALEMLPIYKKEEVEASESGLIDYCINELKLVNPRICMKKIKIQSLFRINGYKVYITGKSLERVKLRNATSLALSPSEEGYIHGIEKSVEFGRLHRDIKKERNVDIFDLIIRKLTNPVFSNRPNNPHEAIINGRDKFLGLGEMDQCRLILEVLKATAIGGEAQDLKVIGGAPKAGVMLHSKKISKASEFVLINQSVTGLYENEVDMLKI